MEPYSQLLAEHYQKTIEQTNYFWERRNKTFLILLAVVGGASLLTYKVPIAAPLMADLVAKLLGIEDAAQRLELRNSFPYGVIQSIFLIVVFYLVVNLYHHTIAIQRDYRYLETLGEEVQRGLKLPKESVAFTREGRFYRKHRHPVFSSLIGAVYVGMLGALLLAFLGMRVYQDFSSTKIIFGVVDILIALPTLFFFGAYAASSSSLFRRLLRVRSETI